MIKATNQKLEVAREKRQNRKKIMKKRKTEVITAKLHRIRGGISLFSKKEENYECDTGDKMNPDQAGAERNLLQL